MDSDKYRIILPKSQYTFLWHLSWLSMFAGMYAIYKNHYDIALAPLGVWITSTNYWIRPDYSWRRYVDIIYVHCAISYQIYRAYNAQYGTAYYILLGIGIFFYPIGIIFHKNGHNWASTICHAQLHIFGNLSNIVLYSGDI